MLDELVPFGSRFYFLLLAVLVFSRGMDFLSTWVATPNLVLEANPLAKKMGWRSGLVVNLVLCLLFATWPLPTLVIATSSLMVAARNFQSAWLMRSLGEHQYRVWISERMSSAPPLLYLFCLFAQSILISLIGITLMYFSGLQLIPFGIGMGLITYALAVLVYSLLSIWRLRSR